MSEHVWDCENVQGAMRRNLRRRAEYGKRGEEGKCHYLDIYHRLYESTRGHSFVHLSWRKFLGFLADKNCRRHILRVSRKNSLLFFIK